VLVAQERVQRPRLGQQLLERRRVGPGLRAQRRERVVALEPVGGQELGPGALPGAELAQAQLAAVSQAHQHAGAAIARAGPAVEELQAAGGHEVDEEREPPLEVDDQMLPAPADGAQPPALQSVQRRVVGLQGIDAGRRGGLDVRTGDRRVNPPRGDLHLR
jgi:hypothetical protein